MAALDLAYFEAHPDALEALSDEDLMTLSQGDAIEGEISGESLDAEQQAHDESQEEVEAEESDPVVLAKDGKHTIPFEELQTAREQARYWQAQAEAAQAAAQAKPAESPAPVDLRDLRRRIREAWESGDIETEEQLQAEADAEILRIAEQRAASVVEQREAEHQRQANARLVQDEADAAIKSYPFLDHTNPATANHEAIALVRSLAGVLAEGGTRPDLALRTAVERVVPMYAPQPQSVHDRAEAVIAKAKTKTPTSMSSIPSSANPPVDEIAAINEMSVESLHDKMMSMPREKILELMARQM